MIARWQQGRAGVDDLIARGHIERVRADRALADLMLQEAVRLFASPRLTADTDPTGSFAMAYDFGRKALASDRDPRAKPRPPSIVVTMAPISSGCPAQHPAVGRRE